MTRSTRQVSGVSPREHEAPVAPDDEETQSDKTGPEEFHIGSPAQDQDQQEDELDEGPNMESERRFRSPVRNPATKRKSDEPVHDDEPGTKKIVLDDPSD